MRYDLNSLRKAFDAEDYIFDEDFLLTIYLALKLNKPLLVEGAAGVGKTETGKVLANIYGTPLLRLQCYEGLDETKALYEWNYQKQLLDIQIKKDACTPLEVKSLFGPEYLLERPLLQAISAPQTRVLLIDEIDKTDEAFEAFLLEMLSDFQVSIPELGTIRAQSLPVIILTSNASRDLSDALKRRCIYLYLSYPSVEKEARILRVKVPGIKAKLSLEIAAAANYLRNHASIHKKPSIAVCFSCTARRAILGMRTDEECGIAKKRLGDNVSVFGFYTYGEFSPAGAGKVSVFHNETFVCLLLE